MSDFSRSSQKSPIEPPIRCALSWAPGNALDVLVTLTHGHWGEGQVHATGAVGTDPTVKSFRVGASPGSERRLEIEIHASHDEPETLAPRVCVDTGETGFSFFLQNASLECPIWIPEYEVAVTLADDHRSYEEVARAIQAKHLPSDLGKIEAQPEESLAAAAQRNRSLISPIWLGLGRDMRTFRVCHQTDFGYWGSIEPWYHFNQLGYPETDQKPVSLDFVIGRGAACEVDLTRRLENGYLPMLHSTQKEDDISYHVRIFTTLETQPLQPDNVRGSNWLAAFSQTKFPMMSAGEVAENKLQIEKETTNREEEVVCCVRVEAVNDGQVPRYAWFKALQMANTTAHAFDGTAGFSQFAEDRVYGVHRLNGDGMARPEIAVLIPPGEKVIWEILIPHQPISRQRALALALLDIEPHWAACRDFWEAKLAQGANIEVPEQGITERIKAGLLHLDLVTLGQDPTGPLLPTVGWYAPIGSESAPIIQFYDSMGWHDIARRSLMFFLLRQRNDGFMQNFYNYELETGPILWTVGEHFRHTRDAEWIHEIADRLIKACDYLIRWRHRSADALPDGLSPGLQSGKVADPDDFLQSYMLNAVSYLGIKRVAEILQVVGHEDALRLTEEAESFREDIRASFREALRRGPVIPLGDGSWVPTAGPWSGHPGPLALYADGGEWFTHGMFGGRDSLIGALYLVIGEVFDAREPEADFLLRFHQQLFTHHNAGFSQPYYCRHDWIHLVRGEVKPFLKTYYNQLTALQDRETYTFWEHYFCSGQHKTHEEAWFLMQTRWMLFREDEDTLYLLSAIPRQWLEANEKIRLENVSTYFGPLRLNVETDECGNKFTAEIHCPVERGLKSIRLRLPHPEGKKACRITGGTYDQASETVKIDPFCGSARMTCEFS